MTATETIPEPTTTDDTWAAHFAALKARYPKVREPILVALHILTQNPDIALDDAKAQAALHGARITAASVSAAQRLLSRQDGAAAPMQPRTNAATTARRAPRPRKQEAGLNVEALVRATVSKIEAQGAAQAGRLRATIRKAIAMLEAAVG